MWLCSFQDRRPEIIWNKNFSLRSENLSQRAFLPLKSGGSARNNKSSTPENRQWAKNQLQWMVTCWRWKCRYQTPIFLPNRMWWSEEHFRLVISFLVADSCCSSTRRKLRPGQNHDDQSDWWLQWQKWPWQITIGDCFHIKSCLRNIQQSLLHQEGLTTKYFNEYMTIVIKMIISLSGWLTRINTFQLNA